MRPRGALAQILAALSHDTPAFDPPPKPTRRTFALQLVAALARDTPAFGSARKRWNQPVFTKFKTESQSPPGSGGSHITPGLGRREGDAAHVRDSRQEGAGQEGSLVQSDGSNLSAEAYRTGIGTIVDPRRPRLGGEDFLPPGGGVGSVKPYGKSPGRPVGGRAEPPTIARLKGALAFLDIRFEPDVDGAIVARWERHALSVTLEGPDDEILVFRARANAAIPSDWLERAYVVVNEWNHTRRFMKAYVSDVNSDGVVPIYAELQVPLSAGIHDALLMELVDAAAAIATSFIDWLYDEGALL